MEALAAEAGFTGQGAVWSLGWWARDPQPICDGFARVYFIAFSCTEEIIRGCQVKLLLSVAPSITDHTFAVAYHWPASVISRSRCLRMISSDDC